MSNLPINDFDQDYVIINTKVTVGKSYKSRGWALSRKDIHPWIPTEKFERECTVIINDIFSEAILRFNPRMFYESDELSSYLKELYDNGYSKDKIPMKIKVPRDNLYFNVSDIGKYPKKNIETELLVGKSYKSKGWQLSKDVVSLLFPSEKYLDEYSIYIDDIVSNANLNLQFRLFYKSDELSEYLEELYNENPRQKVDAEIIFEYGLDFLDDELDVEIRDIQDDIAEEEDSPVEITEDDNSCEYCGNEIYKENENFPKLCPDCVKKVQVLNAYNTIKDSSLSNFIKKEFVEDILGADFEYLWDLLIEYDFLTSFGDLFKLNGNEVILNNYSKYLSDDSNVVKHAKKKRNRDKLMELIKEEEESEEEEDDEEVCITCGKVLKSSEINKCDECTDKALAAEYLSYIVAFVPYNQNFTKLNLVNGNISSLDADLILNKLVQYRLLVPDSDIFYRLNHVVFLNNFVKEYSETPYELQVNYESESSNIPKFSKSDLASEERIDSLIKWKNYGEYVSFKKGQYGFVSVKFKQDGRFMYSKGFGTSYEAKIEAINYLKSLGKVMLVESSEIKLVIK